MWAYYVFTRFKSLYGDHYPEVMEKKNKADPRKLLQCELDQSLPLSVSVNDGKAWNFVDFFYTPGKELTRDMIMEVDLSSLLNADHVQLKLETSFMFWDLDRVAMDFSEAPGLTVKYSSPEKLTKSGALSTRPDASGHIHLSGKESLELEFAARPAISPNVQTSYFLVGTGYYHDNTVFEGRPQLARIAAFSQKGAFNRYSRETFDELLASLNDKQGNAVTMRP